LISANIEQKLEIHEREQKRIARLKFAKLMDAERAEQEQEKDALRVLTDRSSKVGLKLDFDDGEGSR
jgi:hypothetical protein